MCHNYVFIKKIIMKKNDFIDSIVTVLREFYPGEYRVTMEDIKNNVAPSAEKSMLPQRTEKSDCCGAPMKWHGLTPTCTRCMLDCEPAIATNSFSYPAEHIHEIYERFKSIIKEDINEVDFSTRIRGVMYEYADGAPETTPTTEDPVRDAEALTQDGKNKEDIAKAVKDLAVKATEVKNRPKPLQPTTPTLKEYVDENILPTVVEIIKQAERPRSTKKELMEMFKLSK